MTAPYRKGRLSGKDSCHGVRSSIWTKDTLREAFSDFSFATVGLEPRNREFPE
jgi:hypothetical protein